MESSKDEQRPRADDLKANLASTSFQNESSNENIFCYFEEETSCKAAALPVVVGKGKLSPLKESYADGDAVQLECAGGYEVDGVAVATCTDGLFTEDGFTCVEKSNFFN